MATLGEKIFVGIAAAETAVLAYAGGHAVAEHRDGDTVKAVSCENLVIAIPIDATDFDKKCKIYEGSQNGVSPGQKDLLLHVGYPSITEFNQVKLPEAENWDNRHREAVGAATGLVAGGLMFNIGMSIVGSSKRSKNAKQTSSERSSVSTSA